VGISAKKKGPGKEKNPGKKVNQKLSNSRGGGGPPGPAEGQYLSLEREVHPGKGCAEVDGKKT